MRIKAYNLIFLVLILIASSNDAMIGAESSVSKEHQIKAAFIYNFLKFVDWPDDKVADSNSPITIGIVGENPFGNAFDSVKNKKVKSRNIIVKHFNDITESQKSSEQIKALRECHLLFVCRSQTEQVGKIIKLLKGRSVLTVADIPVFLESGGIINFLKEDEKIHFEINNTAAKQAGLKIRSKFLRLAKRVIGKEESNGEKG